MLSLVSTLLGLLAGFRRDLFFEISTVSGIIAAAASVMNGVSRAPLIAHLARENNFADCSAKEGNQSRMLKLVAIGFGFQFLVFVNADPAR